MDKKTLKILLDKFYRGETALGEEELIRKHLSGGDDMEPDLETDRLLIQLTQLQREAEAEAPDIEENLSRFLDQHVSERSGFRFGRSIYRYAAAAVIVLAVGISALLVFRYTGKTPEDTFSDPQLAYHEAEITLAFVSEKINTGMAPLSNVDKINQGTEPLKALNAIEENLERVGFFSFVNLSSEVQK